MRAFLAATPFLLLAVLLWVAWQVLEVLRRAMIPARIRHMQSSTDGAVKVRVMRPGSSPSTITATPVRAPSARRTSVGRASRHSTWRPARSMRTRIGLSTFGGAASGRGVVARTTPA